MRPTFYIVQIAPDIDPHRVKLGWTSNLKNRLRMYRTFSPTAAIAGEWYCPKDFEAEAIAAIVQDTCRSLSREAFDLDSLMAALGRADAYFATVFEPTTEVATRETLPPQPVQSSLPRNERVRLARVNRGWTQAELAEKAGVKLSTIKRYETAELKRPHPHMLKQVADALGVTPTSLMVKE